MRWICTMLGTVVACLFIGGVLTTVFKLRASFLKGFLFVLEESLSRLLRVIPFQNFALRDKTGFGMFRRNVPV